MKKRITGNNQFIKEMNKSIVLDLIRVTKGISRKLLADSTGLSPTASGAIVRSLLQEGYIREIGEGESSGGRKPIILELNPRSYFSFGFDIDMRFIYTVVLDITGEVIYRNKILNNTELSVNQALSILGGEFKKAVENLNIDKSRILGVGVSVPGMLDIKSKRIILAPNLGWSDAELLEPLQEKVGVTVYLDNESMCSASCENWLGLCREVEDFICINIESGIGSGMFMRGKMYRGFSGSAGEVGHIRVDENGIPCKCGNKGCLETIASIKGMVERALHKKIITESDSDKAFETLLKKAKSGDTESLGIFHDAAISLGKAVANLINTINPQKIVLGKRFSEYSELVIDTIRETALKYALPYPSERTEIIPSSFGEDSSALGAAIIPLRKLFGR
ncbi:MAG: ROK family protein [Clostridiaceae bacterium]|nr:ROK family protein [Clostridiaceae bacterium]